MDGQNGTRKTPNVMTQENAIAMAAAALANQSEIRNRAWLNAAEIGNFIAGKAGIEPDDFRPAAHHVHKILKGVNIEFTALNVKQTGGVETRKRNAVASEHLDLLAGMFKALPKQQKEQADLYFRERNGGKGVAEFLGISQDTLFPN